MEWTRGSHFYQAWWLDGQSRAKVAKAERLKVPHVMCNLAPKENYFCVKLRYSCEVQGEVVIIYIDDI